MYIHKQSGARITLADYNNLSYNEKGNFVRESSSTSSQRSSNGDMLTSGIIGAVTDNALIGGILGGSLLGGLAGDLLNDGDLF